MHAHQLWAILIINVKEHKRNLHKSGFWGHTKSYSLFFPLFNVVKTFLKQSFLSVFSGIFFFYHFDHFPSYSSNGQSRCRWLPKHWSPVIIIWRQPVLMLGRPWENFFYSWKGKQAVRNAESSRLGVDASSSGSSWGREHAHGVHTYNHAEAFCCYSAFSVWL